MPSEENSFWVLHSAPLRPHALRNSRSILSRAGRVVLISLVFLFFRRDSSLMFHVFHSECSARLYRYTV